MKTLENKALMTIYRKDLTLPAKISRSNILSFPLLLLLHFFRYFFAIIPQWLKGLEAHYHVMNEKEYMDILQALNGEYEFN